MSRDLCFYKVRKIKEQWKGIRNTDTDPFPENVRFIEESRAADWEKAIGTKCRITYRTVNRFQAAAEIFGKKISYTRSNWPDRSETYYDEEGKKAGVLTEEMLDPYRYMTEETGYVYECEALESPDSSSWYCIDPKEGFLTEDDAIGLMKECVEYDSYYGSLGEVLYYLTKVLLEIRNGETVVCAID